MITLVAILILLPVEAGDSLPVVIRRWKALGSFTENAVHASLTLSATFSSIWYRMQYPTGGIYSIFCLIRNNFN